MKLPEVNFDTLFFDWPLACTLSLDLENNYKFKNRYKQSKQQILQLNKKAHKNIFLTIGNIDRFTNQTFIPYHTQFILHKQTGQKTRQPHDNVKSITMSIA